MHVTIRIVGPPVLNGSDTRQAGGVYAERVSSVRSTVVWTRIGDGRPRRILPDGCMDLIWSEGQLLVAGPDSRAHLSAAGVHTSFIGLRFAPGVGPSVFGVRADQLRDQRIPLDALWSSAEVRRLAEQLAATPRPARVLEATVAPRLADPPDDLATAASLLGRGVPVSQVADAVAMGERQLHRRSLAAFGYGPKMLARVLRFGRALELARTGASLASTAARCGYADQAHLARDARRLAGVPLSQLVRP